MASYDLTWLKNELLNVCSNTYKDEIERVFINNKDNTSLDIILDLLKIITDKINIEIKTYNVKNKTYSYATGTLKDENFKQDELLVLGAQLVYLIRSFLTEDEINFMIGIVGSDDLYKDSATFTQEEVLKNLMPVRNNAIGLSKKLETEMINIKNSTKKKKGLDNKSSLWKMIEGLSYGLYRKNSNETTYKGHKIYQSQRHDFQVYLYFRGGSPKEADRERDYGVTRYYLLDGNFRYFNRGWLFEWYNAYIEKGNDNISSFSLDFNELNNYIAANNSIRPIFDFSTLENIRGTKQGDYKNALNQWTQSKYNNEKIISYSNILLILQELQFLLFQYKYKPNEFSTKLTNLLREHFIPRAAESETMNLNRKLNDMLDKLNKT